MSDPGLQDRRESIVSVVIVSWNTRELLRRCLRSLIESESANRLEVVVVDNASDDRTVETLRSDHDSVQWIENSENRGFAAACNQGVARSRGELVLFLNPDAAMRPGALAALAGVMETDHRVGACGPKLVDENGRIQLTCSRPPTALREAWRLVPGSAAWPTWRPRMEHWALDRPRDVDVLEGSCLMVRRGALDRVGALDERFFLYSEEVDLCARLAAAGYRLVWEPRAVVEHAGGASSRQAAEAMMVELYRSKVRYLRKHRGALSASSYQVFLALAAALRVVASPVMERRNRDGSGRSLGRRYRALLHALPLS